MSRVIIIAEAGVNHNGDMDLAKRLIEVAAEAGVDLVKFQTFKAKNLVTGQAAMAAYQEKNTGKSESQFAMLQRLELSEAQHEILRSHCRACGVEFLSSPFDLESIDFLDDFGVPLFKVPSGEITNAPYLKAIAAKNKPVVLSTGMADLGEVEAAVSLLLGEGLSREQLTILHCNTEYPTPMVDVNLRAMQTLALAFPGVQVGYSDHTLGIEVSLAAVGMGAVMIEKHFTLDCKMEGPDHKASLEPDQLTALVAGIRNLEQAMGDGWKRPSPSEAKNKPIARKSIVAARAIAEGEVFSLENLTIKRPGTGISPMRWDQVMGQRAKRDFAPEEAIE